MPIYTYVYRVIKYVGVIIIIVITRISRALLVIDNW